MPFISKSRTHPDSLVAPGRENYSFSTDPVSLELTQVHGLLLVGTLDSALY